MKSDNQFCKACTETDSAMIQAYVNSAGWAGKAVEWLKIKREDLALKQVDIRALPGRHQRNMLAKIELVDDLIESLSSTAK